MKTPEEITALRARIALIHDRILAMSEIRVRSLDEQARMRLSMCVGWAQSALPVLFWVLGEEPDELPEGRISLENFAERAEQLLNKVYDTKSSQPEDARDTDSAI